MSNVYQPDCPGISSMPTVSFVNFPLRDDNESANCSANHSAILSAVELSIGSATTSDFGKMYCLSE